MNDSTTKRCSKCHLEKPLSEFWKHNGCKDGLRPDCIDCYYHARGKSRPQPIPEGMKYCPKCKQFLPATIEFFFQRKRGGFQSYCRACSREKTAERRRDPIKGEQRRQWERNYERSRRLTDVVFRDKKREKAKKYEAKLRSTPEGLERVKSGARKRQKKQRLKPDVILREKDYRQSEQGRRAARVAALNYLAKKRNYPNTFTNEQWRQCLEYWNYCCAYCGQQRDFWHSIEAEHFIALNTAICPGTIATNIVPSCRYCNAEKADSLPEKWLIRKLGKRKAKKKLIEIDAYFEWVKSQ